MSTYTQSNDAGAAAGPSARCDHTGRADAVSPNRRAARGAPASWRTNADG